MRVPVGLMCCAVLLTGACRTPEPVLVRVPDTLLPCPAKIAPIVVGRLEGKTLLVLFDTGAMQSVIDTKLAERLDLATSAYVFPLRVSMVGGMQSARRYARIDGLEIGDIRIDELELPLLDLDAGAGFSDGAIVIGCEVLRRCRILFDGRSEEIRFLDVAAPQSLESRLQDLRPDDSWTSVPVRWDAGKPLVTIGMDGREDAEVLFDTGALQTAFDPDLVRGWKLSPMDDSNDLVFVDGLRIGPWRARFVAKVTAPEVQSRFGFDVLGKLAFVWDGPADRLLIRNPKPGEPDSVDAGVFIHSILRGMGLEPVRP